MIIPNSLTLRKSELSISDILEDEIVIAAMSTSEKRAEIALWSDLKQNNPEKIVFFERRDNNSCSIIKLDKKHDQVLLSDSIKILDILSGKRFLIDITGLRHNVWAPIVKIFRQQGIAFRVLYAEPSNYTRHPTPSSDSVFDLTTSFESMVPLPGFSKLTDPEEEHSLFVTMLGFEGSRPLRLLEPIEPKPTIIPIVGVPGFKLEYPTFAITCNRDLLGISSASAELRYAKASCPFEAYQSLAQIRRDNPDHYMYIAPVGTKPHALGAILYAIDNPEFTEILYDHPVGKVGRTEGKSKVNIYEFSGYNAT